MGASRDRIETEGSEFHESVHLAFTELAKSDTELWAVIDGSGSADDVAARVDAVVADRLGW
jgi:thymidylate kinase